MLDDNETPQLRRSQVGMACCWGEKSRSATTGRNRPVADIQPGAFSCTDCRVLRRTKENGIPVTTAMSCDSVAKNSATGIGGNGVASPRARHARTNAVGPRKKTGKTRRKKSTHMPVYEKRNQRRYGEIRKHSFRNFVHCSGLGKFILASLRSRYRSRARNLVPGTGLTFSKLSY